MDLNKENIRKWVDALRSGKYTQTTGRLADKVGFCCLGVACEVAADNGVAISKTNLDDSNMTVEYDGSAGELPDKVCEWLGFSDEGDHEYSPSHYSDPPLPTKEHGNYSAVTWNDEAKASFAQIADLIEANYLADPPSGLSAAEEEK